MSNENSFKEAVGDLSHYLNMAAIEVQKSILWKLALTQFVQKDGQLAEDVFEAVELSIREDWMPKQTQKAQAMMQDTLIEFRSEARAMMKGKNE